MNKYILTKQTEEQMTEEISIHHVMLTCGKA